MPPSPSGSLPTVGIAVVGFGWMGQAHSRSYLRIPTLFPDRAANPRLVICADTVDSRRDLATGSFGFAHATADPMEAISRPDVDVVVVGAPNMLHEELCVAAAEAGKHLFCEKPVGGTPEQTARIELAARRAGVITGVGYNYRWAPLVRYAKQLIDEGALGTITNYRGRFFCSYGADPLGLLSWRFEHDGAGYGVSSDILSHTIDLAMMLNGPVTEVVGTRRTTIPQRPIPTGEPGTHFSRGRPGDPTGPVTNEDYAGCLATFANGAVATFEASRTLRGPETQMAFEIYGTQGSISWNLETMNQIEIFLSEPHHSPGGDAVIHEGYTTVRGGERYPFHGNFVPGDANSIGYEDLKVIEDLQFLEAVVTGRQHEPGFTEALAYVSVQAALVRSWDSRTWEPVTSVRIP